jgi:hypothetical protein
MPRRVAKGGNKTLRREVTPEEVKKFGEVRRITGSGSEQRSSGGWLLPGTTTAKLRKLQAPMRKMSGYGLTGLTPTALQDCTGKK